jgi:hypothetical protein
MRQRATANNSSLLQLQQNLAMVLCLELARLITTTRSYTAV